MSLFVLSKWQRVARSPRTDAPRCAHFSTVIPPSWITEQISVGKWAHRGASACRERQTSFKIVTWTKQTWTTHHNTPVTLRGSRKASIKPPMNVKDFSSDTLEIRMGSLHRVVTSKWNMGFLVHRRTLYCSYGKYVRYCTGGPFKQQQNCILWPYRFIKNQLFWIMFI